MGNQLIIDGVETPFDHTLALRWYNTPEGKSIPVLYRNGKRVIKAWAVVYSAVSKEDILGGCANTE